MKTVAEIQTVMDMGTLNAAEIMKLKDYGLKPGCDASFMVFEGSDFYDSFVNIRQPKLVFRSGRLVARNTVQSTIVH
jgi:cytosine deaminase